MTRVAIPRIVAVGLLVAGCDPGVPSDTGSRGGSWSVAPEPSLVIGARAEDPGHLLEVVVQAFMVDGALVIADARASEIRRFDSAGSLEWVVGRRGEGPGEFSPWLFQLFYWAGDTIAASDRTRVHLFGHDGQLIRSWRIPAAAEPMVFSGEFGGTRAFRVQRSGAVPAQDGFTSDSTLLRLLDSDGSPVTTIGAYASNRMHYSVGSNSYSASWVPFSPDFHYSVGRSALWFGHGANPEVVGVDTKGREIARLALPWSPRPVTEGDVDELEGEFMFELPATQPLLGDLIVDLTGSVWVQRYQTPGSVAPQEWSVFSETGDHLADVMVPGTLRVLSIGPDWLTAVFTDDLDVQHVGVFDLSRGG